MSLPLVGVWIEISTSKILSGFKKSLPLVGVWIEIKFLAGHLGGEHVTPLGGSVD